MIEAVELALLLNTVDVQVLPNTEILPGIITGIQEAVTSAVEVSGKSLHITQDSRIITPHREDKFLGLRD